MKLAPFWMLLTLACDKPSETHAVATSEPSSAAPVASAAPAISVTSSAAAPSSSPTVVAPPKSTAIAIASATSTSTPAPPGVGMHFDGAHFAVDVAAPPACSRNAACTVPVRLTAKDDFHVNTEYPYKLKLDDAPGVAFMGTDASGKSVFSKSAGDFALDGEKSGVMTIKFTAAEAGLAALNGTFKLSVCNASNCKLDQAQVKASVPIR